MDSDAAPRALKPMIRIYYKGRRKARQRDVMNSSRAEPSRAKQRQRLTSQSLKATPSLPPHVSSSLLQDSLALLFQLPAGQYRSSRGRERESCGSRSWGGCGRSWRPSRSSGFACIPRRRRREGSTSCTRTSSRARVRTCRSSGPSSSSPTRRHRCG